jgi:hypothetical protein
MFEDARIMFQQGDRARPTIDVMCLFLVQAGAKANASPIV